MSFLSSLFGGGDSQSSSSSQTTTTNTDKRQVIDNNGLGVSGDGTTVYTTNSTSFTDAGSIKAALDFATSVDALNGKSLDSVLGLSSHSADVGARAFGDVLTLADSLFQGGFDSLKNTGASIQTAYQTAQSQQDNAATLDNKYLIAVGLAVVAIVAIKIWGK